MINGRWMTAKEALNINAFKWPDRTGIKDAYKSYTFREWNERACRLANALYELGLRKGDRFAVLAYNCVQWMEIYGAAAKGGFICVPIMFRLAPPEMEYIINHCEAKIFIVQGGQDPSTGKEFPFINLVDRMRQKIRSVNAYISFATDGAAYPGFLSYDNLLSASSPSEPTTDVSADDIWVLLYTSGTTGRPKGVMKSHANLFSQFFIMMHEHNFTSEDINLMVMPCCHSNSIKYSFVVTWAGGTVMTFNMANFNPEELLKTISENNITFTSLVPTHYIMLLSLPDDVKKKYDLSSVKKLLISSAPARKDTKLGIMEMFPNSGLFEAYGSTEAGIVTVLKPHEQLIKLGSCGREVIGSDIIRIYSHEGKVVTEPNVVGEIYSRSPMVFEGYWKEPEKTAEAMKGEYFSAGDMGYRDEDGYYYLVDRKANMIISGGENVFPAEVENVLGGNPKVKDVAVIGTPHEKWGEQVTSIIVLKDGEDATQEEIANYCKGKIAGYKVPRKVIFIEDREMPRNATGKILHRELRERYGRWSETK
jgi:fatty-acyl-CoA synthase